MTNQRKRVQRGNFVATLNEYPDEQNNIRWHIGSCQSPPLGTADEMLEYALFIRTVVDVCNYLNLSRTVILTDTEQSLINQYTT
jgi:hypothetical protein